MEIGPLFSKQIMSKSGVMLGHSQNHLAVAGGYVVDALGKGCAPTRYREVVLTASKLIAILLAVQSRKGVLQSIHSRWTIETPHRELLAIIETISGWNKT
jgi:hypothetical protein